MKAFQRKRLLKLADYLYTIPNRKFDLTCWECDTSACAFGYACMMPSFKKAGLSLRGGIPTYTTSGTYYDGFRAASEFFGLSMKEAFDLFSPNHNPLGRKATPKRVAKQIRQLVERYEQGRSSET